MPEYIDREALKERFRKRIKWLEKDVHDQYSLGLFHGCEYDANLINEPPAADVVPVVHGRWVTDEKGVTYCGRCRIIDDYASVHNYCPNCGARMDGE